MPLHPLADFLTQEEMDWLRREATGMRMSFFELVAHYVRAVYEDKPQPSVRKSRNWKASEDALLGTDTDREIGQRLGRPAGTVATRRIALGIPAFRPLVTWKSEEDALLGTATDREIGIRLNRPTGTVSTRRLTLGIPCFREKRKKAEETEAARREKIAAARRGKPRPPHVVEAIRRASTGRMPSEESRAKMSAAQKARGTHPPAAGKPFSKMEDALLGTATDRQVAEWIGRDFKTVANRRIRLGIPSYRSKVGHGGRRRLDGSEKG